LGYPTVIPKDPDLLEAVVHDHSVVLTPKAVVDKKSLDAYLTERLEELRAGKTVGPFGSMEEYDEYVTDLPQQRSKRWAITV